MKPIDVIANIRKDVSVLSNKLISSARPGHVSCISKVDAGHTLARIERELDDFIAAMTNLYAPQKSEVEECFCNKLPASYCTVCMRARSNANR